MKVAVLISFFIVLSFEARSQSYPCLPTDVKADELVKRDVSVKQSLKKLKAKCYKGRLVDPKRRTIRFFRLQGCWGNPPQDYLEIMEAQRLEIASLRKKYTVIEISCGLYGMPM